MGGRLSLEGLDFADDQSGCGTVVLVIILLPVIVLVAALVIEWVAILAVLPILAILRALFGRPWIVTARPRGRRYPIPGVVPVAAAYAGSARGWRWSGTLIATVRREIGRDGLPTSLSPWQPTRRRLLKGFGR